jgi:hypothetical protein
MSQNRRNSDASNQAPHPPQVVLANLRRDAIRRIAGKCHHDNYIKGPLTLPFTAAVITSMEIVEDKCYMNYADVEPEEDPLGALTEITTDDLIWLEAQLVKKGEEERTTRTFLQNQLINLRRRVVGRIVAKLHASYPLPEEGLQLGYTCGHLIGSTIKERSVTLLYSAQSDDDDTEGSVGELNIDDLVQIDTTLVDPEAALSA